MVDDPDDNRRAGDLVVNQITFGYVVDADKTVARSNGDGSVTLQGAAIAERILLTTTPNKLYGDSIKGNSTWKQRGLPQPDAKDYLKVVEHWRLTCIQVQRCLVHSMGYTPC